MGTRFTIYAALTANLLVAATKFAAALWTGSSAMMSEAFHSLVDTSNEGLLLYGQNRAKAPADQQHPLGHGRELYFWSFVVAILIFALGAGLSFYEASRQIIHPSQLESTTVSYFVYGTAFIFESTTWVISIRNFEQSRGNAGFWEAVHKSKDPAALIVMFEDTADVLGVSLAALGTFLAVRFNSPVIDGIASAGIGLLLAITAALLARETKGLLIGEPADTETIRLVRKATASRPEVRRVGDVVTAHLAPNQIVANVTADFEPNTRAVDLEKAIALIETDVKREEPRVVAFFIKPMALHDVSEPMDPCCS
jgi:cation diffusion facilitator family transporter